jgi:hypothetical protein
LCERTALAFQLLESDILTIRHKPVGIVGIVVVQTPINIHVADVVGIPRIRSTQPHRQTQPDRKNSNYPNVFFSFNLCLSDFIHARRVFSVWIT